MRWLGSRVTDVDAIARICAGSRGTMTEQFGSVGYSTRGASAMSAAKCVGNNNVTQGGNLAII